MVGDDYLTFLLRCNFSIDEVKDALNLQQSWCKMRSLLLLTTKLINKLSVMLHGAKVSSTTIDKILSSIGNKLHRKDTAVILTYNDILFEDLVLIAMPPMQEKEFHSLATIFEAIHQLKEIINGEDPLVSIMNDISNLRPHSEEMDSIPHIAEQIVKNDIMIKFHTDRVIFPMEDDTDKVWKITEEHSYCLMQEIIIKYQEIKQIDPLITIPFYIQSEIVAANKGQNILVKLIQDIDNITRQRKEDMKSKI